MDDDSAARRWHIEFRVRVVERAIERQSQRRIATVAVSLTIAGTAAIARATLTAGADLTTAIMLACLGAVVKELAELRYLERKHEEMSVKALAEADKLMNPGGEPDDDEPTEGP